MVADRFCLKLLKEAGVNLERFTLDWASAAEAPLYVELITNFTKKIKELGPLGAAEGIPLEELKLRLLAARTAAESVKLRTQLAKLTLDLRQENTYSAEAIEAKMSNKLNEAIGREMEKSVRRLA
jgi:F420-non-reducing hydrogenase iron-sulfur subunit